MNPEHYCNSMSYEGFMCRAFQSFPDLKKGVDNSVYLLVIHLSNGYTMKGNSPEKQFQKLKACLVKGFDKFLKRRLRKEEKEQLMQLRERTLLAVYLSQIDVIIEEGITATQRFKEYMPS